MGTTAIPEVAGTAQKQTARRTIELDFARGMAVLLVMGYHFRSAPTDFRPWIFLNKSLKGFGATGVDMFFVLSGFLVGGLLLHEYRKRGSVRVGRFLVRRALKIFPAYYFYILFQVLSRHFPIRSYIVQNLLQIQNYTGTPLSHTWTVSLEIHFYILLALAMGFLAWRKAKPRTLMISFFVVALLSFGSRVFQISKGNTDAAIFYTHNRLDSLLCGVMLATLACFYPARFEALSNRKWLLAGLSLVFIAYLFLLYPTTMEVPGPGWGYFGGCITYLGYATILLFLLRYSQRTSTLRIYQAIARIGTYSYGIYLWHNSVREPCVSLTNHLPLTVRWPALFLLQYVTAIALGVLSTLLIEEPFLRLRERIMKQRDVRVIDQLAHPTEAHQG